MRQTSRSLSSTCKGQAPLEACISRKLSALAAADQPTRSKTAPTEPRCRDLKGCWHSVKALREQRNTAIMRGMRWLHKKLKANRYEALIDVGDDGACIFFEIWYTSSSSSIRAAAKEIALELLDKYERHLLRPSSCKCKQCVDGTRREPDGRDLFIQLMYLIRCKEEMDLDATHMIHTADELWIKHCLSNTDNLFGVTPEELGDVTDENFVVLIMHVMVMEFNQLLFRRRWPLKWGLFEVFSHLRTRTYKGPPYDVKYRFHDCFYFVTHIVFAISAYSAIKTCSKDVPWLFKYNQRSCLYWTKQGWKRLSGRQSDRLVDIDGLAEAVDVMRGCGLTDGGDSLLCSATLVLLALQRPDGSWPYWILDQDSGSKLAAEEPTNVSFYNGVHPTWVAVQSLRDRSFDYERKGNIQWAEFMSRLLKQTNLRQLEGKIIYEWPCKRRSTTQHLDELEHSDAGLDVNDL